MRRVDLRSLLLHDMLELLRLIGRERRTRLHLAHHANAGGQEALVAGHSGRGCQST
jgi:hypothetical protein